MSIVSQKIPVKLITRWFECELGLIEIAVNIANNKHPVFWHIEFKQQSELNDILNKDKHPLLDLGETQLKEYFAGHRKTFSDILCYMSDYGTDFQKKCWKTLIEIPFGETRSYGEQAKRLNNPKAVRAVGGANSKNPLAIVVPCHRVIGANGSLTGYASGVDKKQWLIHFEKSLS